MLLQIDRRAAVAGLLGGAGLIWLTARLATEQARQTTPVIGYLGAETPVAFASRIAAFRQGLATAGFAEGKNVAIEYRWAESQHARLPQLAAELVARKVSLIVAPGGAPAALAARSTTTTIPIIFEMGADPVAQGLVASLNRPGGNATGIASLNVELSPKRLEIMHELIPAATNIAVLINPTSPTAQRQLTSLQNAADALRLKLHVVRASKVDEFEPMFEALLKQRPEGLVVTSDGFFATHAEPLAALSQRHRLPAIHQSRDFALAGGLMSYGGNFMESHRAAGVYAGRVLKGEKPADLPVQQVTKVQLAINTKAATSLGLTFPQSLLARADEAID